MKWIDSEENCLLKRRIEMKTFNEYQKEAMKTAPVLDSDGLIDNAVYGLCGEVGECVDRLKKVKFQGHPQDIEHLVYEMGDILWYLAEMATGAGVTLEKVAEMNIRKLRQRYGETFESAKSINRTDDM